MQNIRWTIIQTLFSSNYFQMKNTLNKQRTKFLCLENKKGNYVYIFKLQIRPAEIKNWANNYESKEQSSLTIFPVTTWQKKNLCPLSVSSSDYYLITQVVNPVNLWSGQRAIKETTPYNNNNNGVFSRDVIEI